MNAGKILESIYDDTIFTLDEGKNRVEAVVCFLENIGVIVKNNSPLEGEYLQLIDELDKWNNGEIRYWSEDSKRAMFGFIDLYNWIWDIKDHREFDKLIPHLKLLGESSIRLNTLSPMMNPVTNKQDDSSNKFIETFIGMYALRVGSNIDLDDPIHSTGGNNPDVMFDYNRRRISIACKTPRSRKFETIVGNVRSAKEQIDKSDCDIGFVVLNMMNVFPHDEVKKYVYYNPQTVDRLIENSVDKLLHFDDRNERQTWNDVFANTKMSRTIVTATSVVAQIKNENSSIHDDVGFKRTGMLTFSTNAPEPWINDLLDNINYFLHGKELYI